MRSIWVMTGFAIGLLGCSSWPGSNYDFDQLRDTRAVELDKRLVDRDSPVANPFGQQKSEQRNESKNKD